MAVGFLLLCLIAAAAGTAPTAVMPQMPPPVRAPASYARDVGVPSGLRQVSESWKAGRPARSVPISSGGWRRAEDKLVEVFRDSSSILASMYHESAVLGLRRVANGDPSVAALLDILEAKPAPARFDRRLLVGNWRVEYSDGVPEFLQDVISQHTEDKVIDLSVVVSISEGGSMDTKAVVTFLGGDETVVNVHQQITQQEQLPSFFLTDGDGESTRMEVTYAGDAVIVFRKEAEHSQVPGSTAPAPKSPSTLVLQSIRLPRTDTSFIGPSSLWRLGLQYEYTRKSQMEAKPIDAWGITQCVMLFLAACATVTSRSRWWKTIKQRRRPDTTQLTTPWPDVEPRFAAASLAGASCSSPLRSEAGGAAVRRHAEGEDTQMERAQKRREWKQPFPKFAVGGGIICTIAGFVAGGPDLAIIFGIAGAGFGVLFEPVQLEDGSITGL